LKFDADGVHMVTVPTQWAYAGKLSLNGIVDRNLTGPAVIEVQIQVEGGVAGLGVDNPQGTDFIIQQPVSGSTPGVHKTYLHVPDISQAGGIVVRTWEKPEKANVRIVSAALVVLAPSK